MTTTPSLTDRARQAAAAHIARYGWQRILLDYVMIALGALSLAAAYILFFVPNNVVSGGISGVAIILHHLLGWPVGLVTLLLNVPLFIAGLRWGGGITTGVRTIFAVVVMSAAIDLAMPLVSAVTDKPLLYVTYGGLLDGLGVGLVLRAQGTTAGTDIVARLLKHFAGLELSRGMFITNALIIAGAALVFGLELAMYGVIVAGVSAWALEWVLSGGRRARQTFIISEKWTAIRDVILSEMERGATIVPAQGAYTRVPRPMLMVTISPREVATLRRLVQTIDPDAFVIVGTASEVFGEGFTPIQED